MRLFRRKKSSEESTNSATEQPEQLLDTDMAAFVDRLRADYELDEMPPGLTKAQQKEYRKQREAIGAAVVQDFDTGYRKAAGMPKREK